MEKKSPIFHSGPVFDLPGSADSFWKLPRPGRRQSLHVCQGSTDSPLGIGLRTVCWRNGLPLQNKENHDSIT